MFKLLLFLKMYTPARARRPVQPSSGWLRRGRSRTRTWRGRRPGATVELTTGRDHGEPCVRPGPLRLAMLATAVKFPGDLQARSHLLPRSARVPAAVLTWSANGVLLSSIMKQRDGVFFLAVGNTCITVSWSQESWQRRSERRGCRQWRRMA